ncbi:uncharacterized protein LOC100881619 isoform X1 [Megachile rotundata]|uniref:uncharacterized protein LOC100881619 isoform X1 n=1 Tax=Megachile rotundata TaxID=143995 RepID=UPI003FCFB46D
MNFTNKHNRKMQTFNTNKIKKFNNVDSSDVSEFTSKSMDVIVDIHREYKDEKQVEDIQHNRKSDKISTDISSNNPQLFFKTNKKNKKSNINLVTHQNFEEHNDINVVDSLDLIEEFQEPLVNKKDEQNVELIKENINQSLIEEKSVHNKQWATIKNTVEELKKPPRKRWSKDNSVIRLPEAKNVSWNKTKRSLPAIKQSSVIQKSITAYDNKAFLSENEEILRIETDHNEEDTKIEIKEIADQLENDDLSMVGNRSSQDSSSRKISNEPAIILDDLNRSIKNVVVGNKHSTNFNKTNKKKHSNTNNKTNISDNSDSSQSLEENYSFEEMSMKDKQLWNKGKSERNPRQHSVSASKDDDAEHLRNSSECTISTTEDDEDQLTEVRYESKLRSDSRRKKLKHAKHHSRSQSKKNKEEIVDKDVSSSTMHTPSVHIEKDTKKKKRKKKIDAKYISITIHRADMLVIDYVTKHPMVKVHIVNAANGKYLKCEHGSATYLQPMITGKFDFKENKSIIPVWEEELVFEHDFRALLETDSEQVVILFEIVDLLSFTEASFNYDKFGHEGCWYKVAWGFLKPVGRNNVLHIEKKIRLQLYKPQKSLRRFDGAHTCEVYTWWKSNIREKYPSSLFITVKSINPPKLEPVYYQQLTLHDSSKTSIETQKTSIRASDLINLPKWTRLAAQSCKIPNETIFKTDTSENGCFYIAFSNDGKYLACSFSEEYDYPIIVYEVETKKIHVRFSGHKTFVYSLHWSNDDNYLLSVSSDQTARIWDVRNQIVQCVEMMPHPLYVYCGKFDPENSSIVATGCYDQITRIWIRDKKSKKRNLSQELEGHEGFVNCMCFQKNSNLLTADSVGIIIIWTVKKNRKAPFKKEWHISRKIRVRDIDGVIINTIVLHPLESRLLVHSRNNGLRMLDLATGVVLQKYNELNNQRIQSTACISPCGSLILCGGEDSSLKVWNLETGNLLAKYTFDRNCRAVTCVDYHPYDHVLAYSTFGNPAPVRVLRFNKDATGEDVDLKIFEETENAVNSHDIPLRFLNSSVRSRDKLQSNDTEQTPENVSKGSLQSSRSYNSSHYKSPNNVSDNYNNTRMRLQRLSEVGQTLKSKSASRLYNIIEKIDRILSNTSRSPGDIESGWNLALIPETSMNTILTGQNKNEEKSRIKSKKDKLAYLSNEIQANSFVESSTTNSDKQEVVELRTLENWSTKKRSKSAKEIRNKDVPKDDIAKTLSDSATNHQKTKFNRKIMKNTPGENIESNFVTKTKEHNSKSIIYHKNDVKDDDSSSSCSTGTYVVDKESTKVLEHRNSILSSTENELNIIEYSESDCSVPSNATFTIENEIPIPKPRKKIGLK